MKKHLLAASLLLSAITSFGAGYQLNLQGLRQLAMGGSGTGWVWDASTIFYNPGGLARLKGIQIYGSALAIMPTTAFGNQSQSGLRSTSLTTEKQTFVPFNFYVGGPIQEGSKFALGLGVYTPFGSGVKWDDNWLGKYLVQSIDLKCIFIQPTISYRISDFLSVGGGFVFATGTFDYQAALPVHGLNGPLEENSNVNLHGNANGVGFNLGTHFRLSENVQLGITYRSQVNMNLDAGKATFTVPASLRDSFPNTHFDSRLPLPQVLSVGVGWRLNDLTLQLDLNYTGWNSYDSLRFNFDAHTSSLQDMHAPRRYKNTLTVRTGANYKVSKVVSLMGGFAYDPSPVPDGFVSPDLPDANRIVLTCGISVKPMPRFTILAALEGVSSVKRASGYDFGGFYGTYQTQAVTPGIGIYYNF